MNNSSNELLSAALALLLAFSLACSGTDEGAEAARDSLAPSTDSNVAGLPRLTAHGECDAEAEVPTAADWASRAQTVAMGTVVEMRPAAGPWSSVLGGSALPRCTEVVQYGIDLVLSDVSATTDGVPDEIVLRITAHELAHWSVVPTVTDDMVEWSDDATMAGIAYGTRLGGFLARSPELGVFLSLGPLFWEDEAARLRFQRGPYQDDCPEALPSDVEERSFDHVARSLADVSPGESSSDLDAYVAFLVARSSLCGDPPLTPPSCLEFEPGELDCPDGLECDESTMTCR